MLSLIVGTPERGKTTLLHALGWRWKREGWDVDELSPMDPAAPYPDEWAAWVWERGDLVALVDELGLYVPRMPDPKGEGGAWYKILHLGRHRNIHPIVASQRPCGLPVSIRMMAQHIYVFTTTGEDDLDYLRRAGGIGPELDEAPHLAVGDFLHFDRYARTASRGRIEPAELPPPGFFHAIEGT